MQDKLGLAIDIGTTTVAAYLVDLETGEKLRTAAGMNVQAEHGADVTSRILYCANNGHGKLTELIRKQIDSMAAGLLSGLPESINTTVIAANTVMQHLAAGYSPVSMGTAPYTPQHLFGEVLPAWGSLPCGEKAGIYYAPAISAYVGGDITAGLLAAGFEELSGPALFIDVGTNGEIVLKNGGTYYCCAAAAGPAFEGAGISMGMAAVDGAVDHVRTVPGSLAGDGAIEFSVIGGAAPRGLCGSGLIDLLALLLDTGAVDETGRLIRKALQDEASGRFYLPGTNESIFVTSADIRSLQLAKAAIAGGIQVLLYYAGIRESDVSLLALAGGFGSYMNPISAARIGLFPETLLAVAKSYGNTAGEGAAMALQGERVHAKLEHIRSCCEYIELSSNAFFNDKFVEQMSM